MEACAVADRGREADPGRRRARRRERRRRRGAAAGARADRAAELAARSLPRSAPTSPRSSTPASRSSAAPASGSTPLPEPERVRARPAPRPGGAARRADVYARGRPARVEPGARTSSSGRGRELAGAAAGGASAARATASCSSTISARRRSRCARRSREALAALRRSGGRGGDRHRLGADGVRALRRRWRGRGAPARLLPACGARRSSRELGEAGAGHDAAAEGPPRLAEADRRSSWRVVRRLPAVQVGTARRRCPAGARGRLRLARPLDLCDRRRCSRSSRRAPSSG